MKDFSPGLQREIATARQARAAMHEESDRIHRERAACREPSYDNYQRIYILWRTSHDEIRERIMAEIYGDEYVSSKVR